MNAVIDNPEPCPLTGQGPARSGRAVAPALTVKVENTDDAYPLAGLERADVVYEEPVEGGITRFAALFQCAGARRADPERPDDRPEDPPRLRQRSPAGLLGREPDVAGSSMTLGSSRSPRPARTPASPATTRGRRRTTCSPPRRSSADRPSMGAGERAPVAPFRSTRRSPSPASRAPARRCRSRRPTSWSGVVRRPLGPAARRRADDVGDRHEDRRRQRRDPGGPR